MGQNILHYKNSKISWYRFGEGREKVICFHGYDESAADFEFLGRHAGKTFSFYAIDLPFHGFTDWKEDLAFTHADLTNIIREILDKENQTFSVMGFSLGGRIALSLYQTIPDQVKKLVLLAPDGLKVNFWYRLATQTRMGNRFFRFTMKHPNWFFGMLKAFNKMKLVNKSIFKFVNYYVEDEKVRHELYTRWTSLRKLKPDLEKIKAFIREYKTPVTLMYGKHDRIILSSVGQKFRNGIEEYCEVKVILAGHQVMHENYVDKIIDCLKT